VLHVPVLWSHLSTPMRYIDIVIHFCVHCMCYLRSTSSVLSTSFNSSLHSLSTLCTSTRSILVSYSCMFTEPWSSYREVLRSYSMRCCCRIKFTVHDRSMQIHDTHLLRSYCSDGVYVIRAYTDHVHVYSPMLCPLLNRHLFLIPCNHAYPDTDLIAILGLVVTS
jgi:hypothetical protein